VSDELTAIIKQVERCDICSPYLPNPPRPVFSASSSASILVAGQAPGRLAHETGIPFNDPSGDRLLELIAKTVECEIRASDAIARLGGDEFVLLLPETDANPARATLQRIRQQLLEMVRRHDWPVSFSVGAVTFSAPPASASDAIAACDRLLYQVKNQGKNAIRHQTFSSDFPPNKENL